MTVVLNNGDGGDDLTQTVLVAAPVKADGSSYAYEFLFAGLTRRAYADTPAELVGCLITGYEGQSLDEQWKSRLLLASAMQVSEQAYLNTAEGLTRCTSEQRTILQGTRHEPVVVPDWDCPVPLVLIRSHYLPAGSILPPAVRDGMQPNVLWIDPSDDLSLLSSLHDLGLVSLHEAVGE